MELLAVPDQGKRITPNAIGGWLNDGDRRRRRHRRIHGIPALLQDTQAGLSGQGLAGRDNPIARHYRHPLGGEGVGVKILSHCFVLRKIGFSDA
jgi:hypothetical protein